MRDETNTVETRSQDKRLVPKLLVLVVFMFGFGFALVPLYDTMCDAFGLNGRFLSIEDGNYDTREAAERARLAQMQVDEERSVRVQFMSSVNGELDWEFVPRTSELVVHPGKLYEVTFYARNRSARTIVGQAVPSLAPGRAVRYFTKLECFCFNQQTFGPGEGREMPLRFFVDPKLPREITTLTLGYTFFDTHRAAVEKNGRDGLAGAIRS